jgi:hypothetical protein
MSNACPEKICHPSAVVIDGLFVQFVVVGWREMFVPYAEFPQPVGCPTKQQTIASVTPIRFEVRVLIGGYHRVRNFPAVENQKVTRVHHNIFKADMARERAVFLWTLVPKDGDNFPPTRNVRA